MTRWKDNRKQYQREWRAKNPNYYKEFWQKNLEHNRERARINATRWVKNNPEKARQVRQKCYYKDIDKSRELLRKRFHILRKNLMKLLGCAKCNHCHISDYEILHFDHINGGGSKEIKLRGNTSMYYYYLRNPELAKKTLQVLCANCNAKKRHTNQEIFKKDVNSR